METIDFIQAALAGVRLGATMGVAGVIFAAGFALVCKAIKWAPINLTVNIKVINDND